MLDAHQDAFLGEAALGVQDRVGLCDGEPVLLIGGQVVDLVGDLAVDDAPVWGLDEPEGIDAGERGQRTDEADVRTLGGLDRAHAAVVRAVDVAHLHSRAVAGEATGAERREPALVGQPRERVVLVHELRQLRGSEELLQRRRHGADVDEGLRGDGLDVLGGHAVTDDTLHAPQAGAQLVLDQLTDGAEPAVAEVVDVVGLDGQAVQLFLVLVEGHDVFDGRDDVLHGEDLAVEGQVEPELLVDLVAADLRQVVALRVEVVVLQQRLGGVAGRGLAGTQLAVDVQQRLILGVDGVLLQRHAHGLEITELLEDAVLAPAEGLEQDGDVLLALAVEAHEDHVALVDLELQPRAAGRDHLAGVDVLVGSLVRGDLEVDARGADELRDDDALGAVDDEGTLVGHQREVTDEHGLRLDLARLVVDELSGHEQRGGVGDVAVLALLDGVLGLLETMVAEGQRHRLVEILDGGDLGENLLQPGAGVHVGTTCCQALLDVSLPGLVSDEPVVGVDLKIEQVGDLERFVDLRE